MSRLCPDDASVLEPRTFRAVTLDACPTCAGLFFDEGEIAAVQAGGASALHEVEAAAVPSDLQLLENAAPRRCPGCRALMHGYAYRYSSDIELSGCDHCGGVWVCDGDLARIAAHLREAPHAFGGTAAAYRNAAAQNAAVRHAATLRAVALRL